MTHAEHFLGRLDRLSARHTEEALLLYNDAELLRRILELARVPERVERVALALDEGGPYVLITRAGRFVTCLGAGMVVDDVPVVSRKQLDDFTGKVGELRARMELARSLVGTEDAGVAKLMVRLTTAGADLSREEFASLVLWQPLVVPGLLVCLTRVMEHMIKGPDILAALRLGKRSRQLERLLYDYWNSHWAAGHIAVLLAAAGPELFAPLPEDMSESCRSFLSWGVGHQGGIGALLHGAWAIGRLGKSMTPVVKRRLREAGSTPEYLTRALSLLALAVRHTGLRAEVLKELSGELPATAFPGAPLVQQAMHEAALLALEPSDEASEKVRIFAEHSLLQRRRARRLPMVPLPDARLVPVVCLDVANFHRDATSAAYLPALVPPVARASAEDLYLPRADLDTFGHGPWTPDHTQALLQPLTARRSPAPATAPASVGRNDPCACGSGKKSKKCCG